MPSPLPNAAEWLEADGLGGFAMGRADGIRTRRYHAILTTATTPPTGRVVLVNGFDAWIETAEGRFALSTQRYAPGVMHPDGTSRLVSFTTEPWPTWRYRLPSGLEVVQELVALHGSHLVALSWRLSEPAEAALVVRPFLSGRDAHATHHENAAFRFEARVAGPRVTWHPYDALPPVVALANGDYLPDPVWYRRFQYDEERSRGLEFVEDLASPGAFTFRLSDGPAVLALGTGSPAMSPLLNGSPLACWRSVQAAERTRRQAFATPLHRAADAYIVRRGAGKTIVAGYPWFSDWGRDTFIAVRGLCIAGDRLDDARDILLEWANHVSQGMLPNYFPEGGKEAEYNSVDASLWYVVAVHEVLSANGYGRSLRVGQRRALLAAVDAIVAGYANGTRFGIQANGAGLLAAGAPGVQLTWMDAKIGDWVVTPRIGKPVEVQALWINALRIAAARSARWRALADYAQASFIERFWNDQGGYLHDVVDVDHRPGVVDPTFRPNQIFAVGGLPWPLVTGARARRIVEAVEARLWTPAGLRSLAPGERGYAPRYEGDMRARDAAYHQGTVWPWVAGAFIEAWVRVHGETPEAKREARERFLQPLLEHYAATSPGHVAEIADAETPFVPRGCPFQAWSVGEALRIAQDVLRVDERRSPRFGASPEANDTQPNAFVIPRSARQSERDEGSTLMSSSPDRLR